MAKLERVWPIKPLKLSRLGEGLLTGKCLGVEDGVPLGLLDAQEALPPVPKASLFAAREDVFVLVGQVHFREAFG